MCHACPRSAGLLGNEAARLTDVDKRNQIFAQARKILVQGPYIPEHIRDMLINRIESQVDLGIGDFSKIENKAYLDGLERKLVKLVSKPEEIQEVRR